MNFLCITPRRRRGRFRYGSPVGRKRAAVLKTAGKVDFRDFRRTKRQNEMDGIRAWSGKCNFIFGRKCFKFCRKAKRRKRELGSGKWKGGNEKWKVKTAKWKVARKWGPWHATGNRAFPRHQVDLLSPEIPRKSCLGTKEILFLYVRTII